MTKYFGYTFLAIFITSIKAQSYSTGDCLDIPVQQNLNFTLFSGVWYEIQTTLRINPIDAGQKCVSADFSDEQNGVVHVTMTKVGRLTNAKNYDSFTVKQIESGHWIHDSYEYKVVTTDYENYAVIIGCDELILGHKALLFIYSRERKLTFDKELEIKEVVKYFGIPTDNLLYTIQDGCD